MITKSSILLDQFSLGKISTLGPLIFKVLSSYRLRTIATFKFDFECENKYEYDYNSSLLHLVAAL